MAVERYAVIDVETTGFSPARDRIVEVAAVLVDGERIADRWSTLVNPGIPIPPGATAVHRITDFMVRNAPPVPAALAELNGICAGRIAVAHNARFDLGFLGSSFAPALCTMRLARALVPEAPNHRNQTLRAFLRIDDALDVSLASHRALDDAVVTAHVLIACRRRFRRRFPGRSWRQYIHARGSVDLSAGRVA